MDAIAFFDPVSSGAPLKNAAREMGYRVVCVLTHPLASYEHLYHVSGEALVHDCDEVVKGRTRDEIIQKLNASPFKIKACIAATEGGVELAEEVAHALGLLCNPLELGEACRDKGVMRKMLKKSGLSCPGFAICQSEKDVKEFAAAHRFPLVIKTPKGASTSQVYVCENLPSLLEAFHSIYGHEDLYGNVAKTAVLEEYIAGKEYIVNTFCDGSKLHVTDLWYYDKIDSAEFKNIYYNIISIPLDDPAMERIVDYGVQVTKAFHIERGIAHIEIKDDPVRGPTMIEVGTRLPGLRLPIYMQKYSNFDPYRATIEVFTQARASLPDTIQLRKHIGVVFCPTMRGGKVKKILGLDKIQKLASYIDHSLNIHAGDTIPSSTYIGTFPCFVFLAHEDRPQLFNDIEAAHELFVLEFEM
jgi:biotin carboxylase